MKIEKDLSETELLRAPVFVGAIIKTNLGHSVAIKKALEEDKDSYVVTFRVASEMLWLTREKPQRDNNV